MIHRRTHPNLDVPGCFGCRMSSVRVGAGALPTRKPAVNEKADWAGGLARDMEAYKTLRSEGLQPPGINGAHQAMMTSDDANTLQGLPKLWDDRHDVLIGDVGDTWAAVQEKAASA